MSDHTSNYFEGTTSSRNSAKKWDKWVRVFHWTSVVFLFIVWLMIVLHDQTEDPNGTYISMHKALGISFFLWTVLRLFVRSQATDLPPVQGPKWQMRLAHYVHIGLYLCLLLMPFTGFFMSEFANRPVNMFGFYDIPIFVTPDKKVSHFFHDLHTDVVWPTFLVLFFLHVGGVMYHQFVTKDDTLKRMM